MAGFILTNKAMFKCAHMVAAVPLSPTGISIAPPGLGIHLTINGAQPICAGAIIAGFTSALCTYQVSGSPDPCVSFTLPAPSEAHLQVDGMTVFTSADLAAIAGIPSFGNAIPGLTIIESEVLVSTT
jgi:hypothetical protein